VGWLFTQGSLCGLALGYYRAAPSGLRKREPARGLFYNVIQFQKNQLVPEGDYEKSGRGDGITPATPPTPPDVRFSASGD